jgi:hypothetical protein
MGGTFALGAFPENLYGESNLVMNAPIPMAHSGVEAAPQIWSGASAPMSPTQKMSGLFDQIDPGASGTITQNQFANAFQSMNPPASFQAAGVGSVWSTLDPQGAGSVTKPDFVGAMTGLMQQLRGGRGNPSSAAGAQALAQNAVMLDRLGGPGSSPSLAASPGGSGSVLNALA